METWSEAGGGELDFITPGRPIENAFIEIFNVRLRDYFLNVKIFLDRADLACKLKHWRTNYNQLGPHSALADQTPEEFARQQARAAQGFPDGGPCGAVVEPSRACCGEPDRAAKALPAANIFERSYHEPS